LAQRIVSNLPHWQAARIARVVYCTAVIDAASNPSGYNEQEVYLKALTTANSVDYIAYGSYVPRVKYAPLAVKAASSRRTDLTDGRSDAGGPPCQHTADFITALRVVTRIHEPAAVGAAFGRELQPILPPFTLISRNELLVLDFRCRFSPDILKHWPTVPAAG
jgi:hypothetical protein